MIQLLEFILFIAFCALFILGIVLAAKAFRSRRTAVGRRNWLTMGCVVLGLALSLGSVWPITTQLKAVQRHFAEQQKKQARRELVDRAVNSTEMLERAVKSLEERQYQHALRLADRSIELGNGVVVQGPLRKPWIFDRDTADAIAGQALYYLDRYTDAKNRLEEVVTRNPENDFGILALAWLLATCPDEKLRNGARAVELVEQFPLESSGTGWQREIVLAGAYAETGQYERAARSCDPDSVRGWSEASVPWVRRQLELYRQGRPYRKQENERPFILPVYVGFISLEGRNGDILTW